MNDNTIVTAFKNNLSKREVLIRKEEKISKQQDKIVNLIQDVRRTYEVVFKNLSNKKEAVCEIEDIFNPRTQYYYSDDERKKGIRKVILFINDKGFSVNRGKDDTGDARNILQIGDEKDFLRVMMRMVKYKNEIWNKIPMDLKKERFGKFVKAIEENNLDKIFPEIEDFNYFDEIVATPKEIEYYEYREIKTMLFNSFFMETSHPNHIYLNSKRRSDNDIQLGDMEKVEQVYDELVAFMDKVIEKQDEMEKSMSRFKDRLIEDFAKELIIGQFIAEEKEAKARQR